MTSIQVQEIKYQGYEMYMIDKVYKKYVKIQYMKVQHMKIQYMKVQYMKIQYMKVQYMKIIGTYSI